jgi:hypothetical protein
VKARQVALESRRRHIRAKIAAQRLLLEQQMHVLEGPARVFDKVRAVGVTIHEHAGVFAAVTSVVMFLFRRRVVRSMVGGWRLARKLSRLLAFLRVATTFMRRHPAAAV